MTIVVLAGGITENENLPQQTQNRLDKAIELFEQKKGDRFLVCGKYSFLFEEEEQPSVTEAELMKNYLINQGIEKGKIWTEKKSMDTISNAYYAKTEYFLPENETEGIIVSSNYHLPRAEFIFKKIFGKEYNLNFVGVKNNPEKKLIKRQQKLLEETKQLTKDMETGNHEFFEDKFFNIDYYQRKRPNWVKDKTTKG